MGFFDDVQAERSDSKPFRFTAERDSILGTVVRVGKPFQGKNFNGEPNTTRSGQPIYTLPVEMETENGLETLFVEGFALKKAIGDALKAIGLGDIAEGITLGVKRLDKVKQESGFMAWQYQARAQA